MVTDGEAAPARSPRWRWTVVAAVTAVVVAIIGAVIVWPRPDATYDDAVRSRFMEACTSDGGEPVRDTCACLYGELARTVAFDRFEQIDEELAAQLTSAAPGQPLALPDDVRPLLDRCVASPN